MLIGQGLVAVSNHAVAALLAYSFIMRSQSYHIQNHLVTLVVIYSSAIPVTYRRTPLNLYSTQQTPLQLKLNLRRVIFTGPPNGPVLFCWLASVVVVCRRL